MRLKKTQIFIFPLLVLISIACKHEIESNEFTTTPYKLKIPPGFPTNYFIPPDNPMTVEGVYLGRMLYYDERLSGKANEGMPMSCGTCHLQEHAFENGVGYGTGTTGIQTHHVMLPHINLLWNPGTFGWNGGSHTLEEVVLAVIPLASEFNSTNEKVVNAIQNIAVYPPLFKKAFGTSEVTVERIAKAIAQFIRTQISGNSKFDQIQRGQIDFSLQEARGYILFTTENGADCFHCHGGSGNLLLTTNLFYNNGKDTVFDLANDRYSITGLNRDRGAYKATTLRNIELTGPYMHDGRFKTLDEVIDFYSEGLIYSEYVHPLMHKVFPPYGIGSELSPMQKADLKAFLLTLTDSSFIHNKELSNPFKK